MGETLTQQRRVDDEGLRVVKSCSGGRKAEDQYPSALTVPQQKAPANYVPAAAVIHKEQALSGIIGRKGLVGGPESQL